MRAHIGWTHVLPNCMLSMWDLNWVHVAVGAFDAKAYLVAERSLLRSGAVTSITGHPTAEECVCLTSPKIIVRRADNN